MAPIHIATSNIELLMSNIADALPCGIGKNGAAAMYTMT